MNLIINNFIGTILVIYCVISLMYNNYPEFSLLLLGLYGVKLIDYDN